MGVRHDITGVVHRITVLGESELIAVGDPSRRNGTASTRSSSPSGNSSGTMSSPSVQPSHVGHEPGVELLSVRLGEGCGNRLVLVAEHGIASNDEGDLRTEAEHIAELRGDVAATEYGESFRQLVDSHDRVGGVVADLVEPGIGGMKARAPAAITICSAVMMSSPTWISLGPTKAASPGRR